MVVGIHATPGIDNFPIIGYILGSGIFRIAVPIFLVINGFYLHQALERKSIRKWLQRAVTLYLTWMLIYSFWWLDLNNVSIYEYIKTLIFGYHHLWYLSGIITSGLIIFMLKNTKTKYLLLLSVSLFAIGVFIQYAGNYHIFQDRRIDTRFNQYCYHRNALFLCFPFMCTGYLFKRHKTADKITTSRALVGSIIGLSLLTFESIINYISQIRPYGLDNLISLAIACPFIYILCAKIELPMASKGVATLSTWVYLIHPMIIIFISNHIGNLGIPLFISTLLLSLIISLFIMYFHRWTKYLT